MRRPAVAPVRVGGREFWQGKRRYYCALGTLRAGQPEKAVNRWVTSDWTPESPGNTELPS